MLYDSPFCCGVQTKSKNSKAANYSGINAMLHKRTTASLMLERDCRMTVKGWILGFLHSSYSSAQCCIIPAG